MHEERLDPRTGLYLAEPLDTWLTASQQDFAIPEAGGSSARVFLLKSALSDLPYKREPAFKVMRRDKIQYAKPLFREEYQILAGLRGMGQLTQMLEGGFFLPDPTTIWPLEIAPLTKQMEDQGAGTHVTGKLAIFTPDEVDQILEEFDERINDGWLPFLILERRWEDNLYLLCDAGYTRGEFIRNFTMKQALDISRQICGLLEEAHKRGATYLDHKILHYYWNDLRHQVIMIDWNIGHWNPNDFKAEIQQADMVQFSSRALSHIFTGRQAPGSVAVGANRPEDIANSPTRYKASYSFDVQKRLNAEEMKFLETALEGGYKTPAEMKDKLDELYLKRS